MESLAAAAFLQVSGRAYFKPLGDTSQIDLGNCTAQKLDYKPERAKHYLHKRGKKVLNIDKVIGSNPAWTITVDEFYTPMLPYLMAAAGALPDADITQAAATASTYSFTSKKGRTFDIGKYNLSNATLTTPVSKVEGADANAAGADYVIDRVSGKVYIPLGSSIVDATACVVTFDCALVVFDAVTAFGQFNFAGRLEIQTQDDFVSAPREVYFLDCNLSLDNPGNAGIDKFRDVSFMATSTSGSMAFKGRKN